MTALLKIAFITFALSLFSDNDCKLLPNGIYRFIQIIKSPHTIKDKWIESRISINNNNFSQRWENGDSAMGKIKWIYNCIFQLDYMNRQNTDTSEFSKVLSKSFGVPYFELKEQMSDTILFRTGNLHITTGEGMIIKIK